MSVLPLICIGIDIVSLKRMERVLQKRGERVYERLLTPGEKANFLQRKNTGPAFFSKLFAAKEAFFKASRKDWMGVDGFSKIEIRLIGQDQFEARWVDESSGEKEITGQGCFFCDGDLAGAQVMVVNSCVG